MKLRFEVEDRASGFTPVLTLFCSPDDRWSGKAMSVEYTVDVEVNMSRVWTFRVGI